MHQDTVTTPDNPFKELLPFLAQFTERVSFPFEELQKMAPEEHYEWISKYCDAVIHEAVETRNELPWKWWKKPSEVDHDKVKKECVDVLLFALALCQIAGFNPQKSEELWEAVLEKYHVNHQRQDTGY